MSIVRHAVALVLLALAGSACGAGQDPLAPWGVGTAPSAPASSLPPSPTATRTASPSAKPGTNQPAQATLPRGGREVFPRYRLVGYAGVTGAATLGRLGTGPLKWS